MKIILQREVEKLGTPGEVVEVADGYARNYLIPRGMAAPAAKGAVRHAERLRQAHSERVRKAVTDARAVAAKLTRKPLIIQARVGDEGRLFGSITALKVAEELKRQTGIEVDRHEVHMAEPIKSAGAHEVTVHLHPEVDAKVTVEVVPGGK